MRIQSDKLVQLIRNSELGTGTLSSVAKIHPDELQKLIALSEGPIELVERIEGILGDFITLEPPSQPEGIEKVEAKPEVVGADTAPTVACPVSSLSEEKPEEEPKPKEEPTPKDVPDLPLRMAESHTVNELIDLVERGELEPKDLLDAENVRDEPRVTLVNWLEVKIKGE